MPGLFGASVCLLARTKPPQFKPTAHLLLGLACHHLELGVQVHIPKGRNLKHLILQAASRGREQGSPPCQPCSEPSP